MSKQLIYSVEDDESIRDLINYALTNEGYEVVSFADAEDMLNQLSIRIPELILLDIMLPGIDGIQTLKLIREKYKNINIRIIMLTAKNNEISKISGLNSGADDFITKPFSVLELIARIKANLRKFSIDVANDTLSMSGIQLNTKTRSVSIDGKNINLTLKEYELLKFLLNNVNNAISRETLINEIWGFEYFGDTRTVDIHIKNLRAKLENYSDCIVSIRGIGYILKEK